MRGSVIRSYRMVYVLVVAALLASVCGPGSNFVGGFLISQPAWAGSTAYSGFLQYDTGLAAPGTENRWADSATRIDWTVTVNEDYVDYSYTFAVPEGGLSHIIFEVSDNIPETAIAPDSMDGETIIGDNDFYNFSVVDDTDPYAGYGLEIKVHEATAAGGGNPGMAEDMYGMKFDDLEGEGPFTISFHSRRQPVWGDFFAKSGTGTQTWNRGFTSPDTDPEAPVRSGSESNHLLVPDTHVPEPSAAILAMVAALFLFTARRRRGFGASESDCQAECREYRKL